MSQVQTNMNPTNMPSEEAIKDWEEMPCLHSLGIPWTILTQKKKQFKGCVHKFRYVPELEVLRNFKNQEAKGGVGGESRAGSHPEGAG